MSSAKKTGHVVTARDAAGNVVQQYAVRGREAPGADRLDRDCRHGCSAPFLRSELNSMSRAEVRNTERVREFMTCMSEFFAESPSPSDVQRAADRCIKFWLAQGRALLSDAKACDAIAQLLWRTAVDGSCTELGYGSYTRLCVVGVLTIRALACMGDRTEATIAIPELEEIDTDAGMFVFMHRAENRRCMCMQYVAAAFSDGDLVVRSAKIKSAPNCAHCNKALALPMKCAACMQVAYCDQSCQRAHWKSAHKKECQRHVAAAAAANHEAE